MSGTDRFVLLLERYRYILAWSLGGSAVFPLLASLSGLAPPLTGITLLTSLLTLVGIVIAFQFLDGKSRRLVNMAMLVSLLALFIALGLYLFLYSSFVFEIPGRKEKIVLGCGWSSVTLLAAPAYGINPEYGCPGQYEAALRGSGYNSSVVWVSSSVGGMKLVLSVVWLIIFLGLSGLFGSFLVYQERRT